MNTLYKINLKELNKKVREIQKNCSDDNTNQPPQQEINGEGIALLKNFAQGLTTNGNPKYTGTLANIEEAKFNTWYNSQAYDYFENLPLDVPPHVVYINYALTRFGIVIKNISKIDGYNPEDFIHQKYSIQKVISDFYSTLQNSGITENAFSVINYCLHINEPDEINNRLCREYAAYANHDNCSTGLLAHMTKCIKIYNGVKGAYTFLSDQRTNDLMVISIALHDIGKIYEMHDGVYQKNSFLTHRGLGFEYLIKYKDLIINLYDEEFFYMVCSVLLQHHGEYGENPKTLYAMLVHTVDNMEAQLTSVDEMLCNNAFVTDASGTTIKYNGAYINILSYDNSLNVS